MIFVTVGTHEQPFDRLVSHIDALVDYYGAVVLESKADRAAAFRALGVPGFVTDIANGWLSDPIKDMPWAKTCEDAWMGKPFEELTDAEKQAASPLYYAGKNLSADSGLYALIWHGDADITVPWTQSQALYDLLQARGIRVTLVEAEVQKAMGVTGACAIAR